MPRTKRGPALFDLLARGADRAPELLKVPRWWARRDTPVRTPQAEMRSAEDMAGTLGPSVVGEPTSGGSATDDALSSRIAPLAELDGGLIRLSFTSLTAAIGLFVVAIVLIGALAMGRQAGDRQGFKRGYEAGRASYAAGVASEVDAARGQPPATHVVSGLLDVNKAVPPKPGKEALPGTTKETQPKTAASTDLTVPGGEAPTEARPAKWIRGHTYLVAQEFVAGRADDAGRAREFLAQNGVAAEVVRSRSGAIQVITTQGYDRDNPAQREMADQLLKKVQALGTKYFAAGGGYKMQGYFKTLKGDSW